ncbi:PEP/pyruvate-binding domain-containing protein [Streptomyces sp. IBSBF 3136]|uniref:PEP/pyruvate-binding domain-containing protein n=1 Tax=Streptomyces sp. IBSBF 3136 TaxID=2903524 RepID=UPI002FDC47BF
MVDALARLAQAHESHGGKAAGLRKLIDGGFTTPPGVALSSAQAQALLDGEPDLARQLSTWLTGAQGTVAVRSSATDEDGSAMSFAGMFESRLGVPANLEAVARAVAEVSASGSSARVASYGGSATDRIPVVIQQMIHPRVSGVAFTSAVSPDGGDCLYLEWVEGLGEELVSGRAKPHRAVIPWSAEQPALDRSAVSLYGGTFREDELTRLCDAFDRLRDTFPGEWDVEWCIDADGGLWLLQMRPVTRPVQVPAGDGTAPTVAASPGLAAGPAFLVDDEGDTSGLRDGDVLVAEITEVDFVPAMRRASAIVTEQGGLLSHAAIVARELGKPCVVGATGARDALVPGTETIVDGTTGQVTQGSVVLGSARPQELDWRSLCFYDRGFEFTAEGHSLYIEALPGGLVAYTSEEIEAAESATVQRELRRHFHQDVSVVTDQKLLWFWEWRRFDQLAPVTLLEASFRTAVARWDSADLARVVEAVKSVAANSAAEPGESRTGELYVRELGAALHSLCGIAVEGIGAWNSYRDTALWRREAGVSFNEMLTMPDSDPRATDEVRHVLSCLRVLSALRNEAYPFFIRTGAFHLDYFEKRPKLVAEACDELEIPYEDESASLKRVYKAAGFRRHDAEWQSRVLKALAP